MGVSTTVLVVEISGNLNTVGGTTIPEAGGLRVAVTKLNEEGETSKIDGEATNGGSKAGDEAGHGCVTMGQKNPCVGSMYVYVLDKEKTPSEGGCCNHTKQRVGMAPPQLTGGRSRVAGVAKAGAARVMVRRMVMKRVMIK